MSLIPQISVTEELNSFTVFDCTGKFGQDNKGGYGGLNYKKSAISKAYLLVQNPSDTEAYPHVIDVTDTLPNEENLGLEILPNQVGQDNNEMESGQWKFKLELTFDLANGGKKTVTAFLVKMFISAIECCIDKQTPRITQDAFKNPVEKKITELSLLLFAVKKQIARGYYDLANKTIDYLKSQCLCPGC